YADSLAQAINYPDLLAENYLRLANLYSEMADFRNAYRYHQKHTVLKDSLFTQSSQKNIAELHVKYQSSEKDKRILQQESSAAKQRLYMVVIAALLFLTILITIFVYRTRRLKEEKLKEEALMQAELLK